MKVYVLLFSQDISGTKGQIDEFIKISKDKDELLQLVETKNQWINEEWDDDDMEWNGVLMDGKPYYHIQEIEI